MVNKLTEISYIGCAFDQLLGVCTANTFPTEQNSKPKDPIHFSMVILSFVRLYLPVPVHIVLVSVYEDS
jgi:hypothetical protein